MSKKGKVKTTAVPPFETALSGLEKIVEHMESGDLALEDSLKSYEEGVRLARFCTEKLNEVQKRVDVLKKNNRGEWIRTPLDGADAPEDSDEDLNLK
jgi:exodeoxyribonuclease VII small subunit